MPKKLNTQEAETLVQEVLNDNFKEKIDKIGAIITKDIEEIVKKRTDKLGFTEKQLKSDYLYKTKRVKIKAEGVLDNYYSEFRRCPLRSSIIQTKYPDSFGFDLAKYFPYDGNSVFIKPTKKIIKNIIKIAKIMGEAKILKEQLNITIRSGRTLSAINKEVPALGKYLATLGSYNKLSKNESIEAIKKMSEESLVRRTKLNERLIEKGK